MEKLSGRLRIYRCPYCEELHFTKLRKPDPIYIGKPSTYVPRKKRSRRIRLKPNGEVEYLE